MQEKIPLRDIVYHPTFNCNLTCRGCVNYSNHLETRQIPDESNWERDLDILFERFDVSHIEVAGGETLMFPHLQQVLAKLAPVKVYTVTTNGLLLHKNMWLKDLLDSDSRLRLTISVHGHPMLESIYIKNLCESVGKFIDMSPDKFKRNLRQHFIANTGSNSYKIYNDRIKVKNQHKGLWAYPLMDENELPVQFNNSKEDAYRKCICPAMHIKNGKIYKCPVTAMLPSVLDVKKIYDKKWQYIRDYKPYNLLEEHNSSDWERLRQPENVCTKCPYFEHEWDSNKTDLHSKIVFGESVLK